MAACGQRARRDVADAVEIGRRQAAADLGDRLAVRAQEKDRAAIALEQHHRVIDEAGQDAVEVKARADVAGHPAEGLRTVEEMGDLVRAPSAR